MRSFIDRRLLLDTNFLLEALVEGRPQSQEAWKVLGCCNDGGDMGLATSGSLKDVYYVLARGGREAKAREAISLLTYLLVVAPVGAEECGLALHVGEPDFEDGLVRAYTELNDVDFIFARDAHAFKRSRVREVTCAEYLEIVGG